MKRFHRLNGSSVLVTRKEWNRRTAIQDAYIRRNDLIPFRNRLNEVSALDLPAYRKRVTLQRRGRFYASSSFDRLKSESTPAGQKKTLARLERAGFLEDALKFDGERYYAGPPGTACTMVELGEYMATVLDVLPIVLNADGRPNVVTRVQFTIGVAGSKDREAVAMSFISSKRGGLTKTQQKNRFRDNLARQLNLSGLEIPIYRDVYKRIYILLMEMGKADGELLEGSMGFDDQLAALKNEIFECIDFESMFAVAPI